MSGTAQIFPVVGSNFNLPNPLPTEDVADGAPGQAAPTIATQIAGVDSTGTLRTISTDASGDVNVNANIPAVAPTSGGAPGATIYTTESQNSPVLIVLKQILAELRALRAATVALVTEGGSYVEADFVPENLDPDLLPDS